jgi:sucrose phosphorylase
MMPETFRFIDELTATARELGLEVLVEIHSYYKRQVEIAERVDRVYDFALPPLVLHALFTGKADALRRWIEIRPRNAVTVLDTHDGIGVIDVGADASDRAANPGLLSDEEMQALVARIHQNSNGESLRATGAAAANLDLYQVNCTFYDALGRDDLKLLLARAIQFFLPGVPQVYYVGLLAGSNDMALLGRTNVGRDINRHYYTREEIDEALARPVVVRLLELIRLRNSHPAFDGEFAIRPAAGEKLVLRWQNRDEFVEFSVDLSTLAHGIEISAGRETELVVFDGAPEYAWSAD